jgi:hypothetical protein
MKYECINHKVFHYIISSIPVLIWLLQVHMFSYRNIVTHLNIKIKIIFFSIRTNVKFSEQY